MSSLRTAAALSLAALSAPGCQTDAHAPTTPIPHVTYERAPAFETGYRVGQAYVVAPVQGVTVGQRLAEFCLAIAAQGGPSVGFGALPVVTYDLRREGPWVSELGVRLADEVSQQMDAAGYRGPVLNTRELDMRIRTNGLDKSTFSSLPAVAENGRQLGLQVVAFGTLKRENNVGVNGRDLLTLDFTAVDVLTETEVARVAFEVASDIDSNRTFFELAQRESLWLTAVQ